MTIKNVIQTLQKAGYNVSFYKRKDGGIRITRIDDQTFRGSEGNKIARSQVGASLSEAQQLALSKLVTPKGKGSYNKRRRNPVDDDTEKTIRRLQRLYRKQGKKEGKPTRRNYRYILQTKGKEEADRLLKQAERRILGYAYLENVDTLLNRIALDLQKKPNKDMEGVYNIIYLKRFQFLDKWISPVYEILYDWEQGQIEGDETARRIRQILL